MIVDSGRLGAGDHAADIAAILTERGLGGDGVDLEHRLDQFRRDRSQRASAARQMAQRWAAQVASRSPTSTTKTAPSSPSPLWGRVGVGGTPKRGFHCGPPPPTPPHKGEGS